MLRGVMEKAAQNGVRDLVWLGGNEARALEPELSCLAAFHSPSTGIIDSHGLMLAYEADAEAAGAGIVLRAPVLGGRVTGRGFALEIGGAEPMTLECELLVNSAGLEAPALARRIDGLPPAAAGARSTIAAASISPSRAGRRFSAWSIRCPRRRGWACI